MKKLIAIAGLFITCSALAQKKHDCAKPVFRSINNIGMLEGETGDAFQIQTINGIKKGTWFAGLGTGIDGYMTRSVPLFFDVRKQWKASGKTPFVYADAGMHFIWPDEKMEGVTYKQPGLFYEAGMGYSIPVKTNAVLLSAGYSVKSFKSKEQAYYYWLWDYYPETYQHFDYTLRRVSIKVGFSF